MKSPNLWPVFHASGQQASKSVLTPLLWLNALLIPAGVVSALRGTTLLSVWILILATLVILFTLCAYAYFAWTAPERLQSEGHIQEMAGLAVIGQRGHEIPISGKASGNPALETSTLLQQDEN